MCTWCMYVTARPWFLLPAETILVVPALTVYTKCSQISKLCYSYYSTGSIIVVALLLVCACIPACCQSLQPSQAIIMLEFCVCEPQHSWTAQQARHEYFGYIRAKRRQYVSWDLRGVANSYFTDDGWCSLLEFPCLFSFMFLLLRGFLLRTW